MSTRIISIPIKDSSSVIDSDLPKLVQSSINNLRDIGAIKGENETIILDFDILNGKLKVTIPTDAIVDYSKFSTNGSEISFPMNFEVEDKQFSAATISERLRINKLNPKIKFKTILLDYKKFYVSKKKTISSDPMLAKRLRDMFLLDMMGIFTEVLPYIEEGKQLSTLTGLGTVTEGLNMVSKDLSLAYRKALKQAKGGQISKVVFTNLQRKYSEFMNILIPQVFPGIDEIIKSMNSSEQTSSVELKPRERFGTRIINKLRNLTKTHSEVTIGRLEVTTNNPDKLREIFEAIQNNQGTKIKVDITSSKSIETVTLDSDISIESIESTVASESTYSIASDGRIKLFE